MHLICVKYANSKGSGDWNDMEKPAKANLTRNLYVYILLFSRLYPGDGGVWFTSLCNLIFFVWFFFFYVFAFLNLLNAIFSFGHALGIVLYKFDLIIIPAACMCVCCCCVKMLVSTLSTTFINRCWVDHHTVLSLFFRRLCIILMNARSSFWDLLTKFCIANMCFATVRSVSAVRRVQFPLSLGSFNSLQFVI